MTEKLTQLQERVLAEIRKGSNEYRGFPRTYAEGTPELDAANELEVLGLVFHSTESPSGWYPRGVTLKGDDN